MGWHWGVLASSGGGAAGAYELISTTVLNGAATSVTFNSIPANTYKHLQIRYVTRQGSSSGFQADLNVRLNGATTGYAHHRLVGNGASVSSSNGTSADRINLYLANGPWDGGTTTKFAGGIIDILDYSSTVKTKTVRVLAGHDYFGSSAPSSIIGLYSGLWNSTAAMTSLEIYTATNDIGSGSRFSLYGIKG